MTNDLTERMSDLRDRARRIYEVAKEDDDVPDVRVAELGLGLVYIETGWETVENHPDPKAAAPYDLEAKLDEWEQQFDERERELGIA